MRNQKTVDDNYLSTWNMISYFQSLMTAASAAPHEQTEPAAMLL